MVERVSIVGGNVELCFNIDAGSEVKGLMFSRFVSGKSEGSSYIRPLLDHDQAMPHCTTHQNVVEFYGDVSNASSSVLHGIRSPNILRQQCCARRTLAGYPPARTGNIFGIHPTHLIGAAMSSKPDWRRHTGRHGSCACGLRRGREGRRRGLLHVDGNKSPWGEERNVTLAARENRQGCAILGH